MTENFDFLTPPPGDWASLGGLAPSVVQINGVDIVRGSRVRLRPAANKDIFDLALAGRVAIVEAFEQNVDDTINVAVVMEDDPGREWGQGRFPGHRFFFSPDELEPVEGADYVVQRKVLVAGIGNIFFGDDGFGVEVVHRLDGHEFPENVTVRDFGIRGMDLAFTLQEDWEAVVLVDAVARGQTPGTVSVIEVDISDGEKGVDAHGMDPVKVIRLARAMGHVPERMILIGCEPLVLADPEGDEIVGSLSEPVAGAIDAAVEAVKSVVAELTANERSA